MSRKYNLIIHKNPRHLLKLNDPRIKLKYYLPDTIDLRPKMPPIYDQGSLSSCTVNALTSVIQYMIPDFMGSRLFLYYNERFLENSTSQDSGALLIDGINALEKFGICSESSYPYDITKFDQVPPQSCYSDAIKHRVIKSHNIHGDIISIKTALVQCKPVIVGIQLYESFESEAVTKTGVVPMPDPSKEKLLGGHCVVICGFDDSRQQWIMRNSFGSDWGDKGYFYLPYQYLLNYYLASDFWVLDKLT